MIKICHQPREESGGKRLVAANSIYHGEDKQTVNILKSKCCFVQNNTTSMAALYLRFKKIKIFCYKSILQQEIQIRAQLSCYHFKTFTWNKAEVYLK